MSDTHLCHNKHNNKFHQPANCSSSYCWSCFLYKVLCVNSCVNTGCCEGAPRSCWHFTTLLVCSDHRVDLSAARTPNEGLGHWNRRAVSLLGILFLYVQLSVVAPPNVPVRYLMWLYLGEKSKPPSANLDLCQSQPSHSTYDAWLMHLVHFAPAFKHLLWKNALIVYSECYFTHSERLTHLFSWQLHQYLW